MLYRQLSMSPASLFCFKSFPKPTSRAQGDKSSGLLVTCKAHPQEFEEAGLQNTSAHSRPKILSVEPTKNSSINQEHSWLSGKYPGLQVQGHVFPTTCAHPASTRSNTTLNPPCTYAHRSGNLNYRISLKRKLLCGEKQYFYQHLRMHVHIKLIIKNELSD